jgi:hypothetical protein
MDASGAILDAAEAILAEAARSEPGLAGGSIVAIGWATVDTDRAERELGHVLGARLGSVPMERDADLGAFVRRATPFEVGPSLLLLEPDTEGRLAAILARHGEGVALVVVAAAGGTYRLTLTSDRGGRSPRVAVDRRPSAAG